MIEDDRVAHEAHYPHPVERVWAAITDADALAVWLMPNDFAPVVGHLFRMDARPSHGFIAGEVLDVEPPHRLCCRWDIEGTPTIVTIVLRADDHGTWLRVEHDALPPDARAGFDGGWSDKLADDLPRVLEGRP